MLNAFLRWFAPKRWGSEDGPAPVEAVILRTIGVAWLAIVIVGTFTTRPHPALDGRGLAVLLALIGLIGAAISTQPQRMCTVLWKRVASLLGVLAASAVLLITQRNGVWQSGPVFIAIMAALHFDRRAGIMTVAGSLAVLVAILAAQGRGGVILSVLMTAIPWYLVMRLLRAFVDQRDELAASREAEADAAAAAERGRLAREMHDVLAHSLSALALQLESTRLLARKRGADDEVATAIDRAHHLAASGLDEARRAIATQRGDELPGPERIGTLAAAFGEQSGLPVQLEIHGEPRELGSEARLAVYRTAQEALTNVRRHATAERVAVRLDYQPESTVLVVEDHAVAGSPPPIAPPTNGGGYGLTGMRERAELLGGELVAAPTPTGFRVELRLPVVGR
jgi:signal transduction histidine kinase